MRLFNLAAVAVALFAAMAVYGPQSAEAEGLWRERAPSGWSRARDMTHYVSRRRYRRDYRYGADPYAYRYVPRGYYPYYNSGYWRPAHLVRKRRYLPQPPYYSAWGDNRRRYRHREWHYRNHGRIRHGHW